MNFGTLLWKSAVLPYLNRKRILDTEEFQSFQVRLVRSSDSEFFVNLECTSTITR
jgi:hypothetical protein